MKLLATAVCAGTLTATLFAETVQELTTPEVFKTPSGETLSYRLYLPKNVPADKKLPLVLFLHGAGERGSDNSSQLKHGVMSLIRHGITANDPAILLVPQCSNGMQWVSVPWAAKSHTMPAQPSLPMKLALALVHEKLSQLPVDPLRVYVTGVSMGGYGTWDAIQREPGLFAAAMPICGGGDTACAPAIKHIPLWIFHGDKDGAVPVERSRDMFNALKACGSAAQYREYPGAGHDVWTRTYADPAVLTWFFAQRLLPPPV